MTVRRLKGVSGHGAMPTVGVGVRVGVGVVLDGQATEATEVAEGPLSSGR